MADIEQAKAESHTVESMDAKEEAQMVLVPEDVQARIRRKVSESTLSLSSIC